MSLTTAYPQTMTEATLPPQETPEGVRIPVPKRLDVLRDLRKAAKADQPSDTGAGSADQE